MSAATDELAIASAAGEMATPPRKSFAMGRGEHVDGRNEACTPLQRIGSATPADGSHHREQAAHKLVGPTWQARPSWPPGNQTLPARPGSA